MDSVIFTDDIPVSEKKAKVRETPLKVLGALE
jgi:hypothetical protein